MPDPLLDAARKLLDPKTVNYVIYHFPCHDGFTAAWCAYMYLLNYVKDMDEVTFYRARHGGVPPDVTNKNVIIVDFSYKRDVLVGMKEKANNLIVLDHHISAQKELEGLDFGFFDMERSGAGLAWDYFFEMLPRPTFVNYVEDRDLWRWTNNNNNNSKDFMIAFMELVPMDFNVYATYLYESNVEKCIADGALIRQYVDRKVERACQRAVLTTFLGHKIKVVNSTEFVSDVGNKLCQDCDFVIVWYHDNKNKRFPVSLRSNGDVDVSEIAKKFGGGGHAAAAGFVEYCNVLELVAKNP